MFNTYPDDFFLLQRQIKMRRIDEYLMEASIIANSSKEPDDAKQFIEDLMNERRWFRGDEDAAAELDIAAFDALREQLKKDSITIKAK